MSITAKNKKVIGTFLKKTLPILFYVLLVIFLILYLKSIDFSKFKDAEFVWSFVAIASFFGLVMRFWQILAWLTLLKGLGAKGLEKSLSQLVYVYAKSWLGRYIPGTAPWILGRIYFASQHGISKNKLAVGSLLEGGLQITVLLAVSFLMLIFDKRLDVVSSSMKLFMVAILVGCVVAVLPPIFNKIIAITYRILKRKEIATEHQVNGKTIVKGVLLFTVNAVWSGLSLFFIAKAVYPELDYGNLLFVMGTGNLAAAIGMLAIFVPSGIGVRDGIQLALLSIIMPTELALLVTITTRLWGLAIDLIFFGLGVLIDQSVKLVASRNSSGN